MATDAEEVTSYNWVSRSARRWLIRINCRLGVCSNSKTQCVLGGKFNQPFICPHRVALKWRNETFFSSAHHSCFSGGHDRWTPPSYLGATNLRPAAEIPFQPKWSISLTSGSKRPTENSYTYQVNPNQLTQNVMHSPLLELPNRSVLQSTLPSTFNI